MGILQVLLSWRGKGIISVPSIFLSCVQPSFHFYIKLIPCVCFHCRCSYVQYVSLLVSSVLRMWTAWMVWVLDSPSCPSLSLCVCACLCQYFIFSPTSWLLCPAPCLIPHLESGLAGHSAAFQFLPFRKFAIQMSVEKRSTATPDTSQAADECVAVLHQTLGALVQRRQEILMDWFWKCRKCDEEKWRQAGSGGQLVPSQTCILYIFLLAGRLITSSHRLYDLRVVSWWTQRWSQTSSFRGPCDHMYTSLRLYSL